MDVYRLAVKVCSKKRKHRYCCENKLSKTQKLEVVSILSSEQQRHSFDSVGALADMGLCGFEYAKHRFSHNNRE